MSEGNLNATETGRTLEFPLEVMTGAAGEFANLYANRMEAPPQFFFMSYLTCLGVALADKLTLETALKVQPRLYAILLGESANTHKSTAITTAVSFFQSACPTPFAVCKGVGSAEGLQKELEKRPALLLYLDELQGFLGKARIESSALLPCVTTLFEDNEYQSETKHTSIKLGNAHLSILAASTVASYATAWRSTCTSIGFNNRLFLVPGEAQGCHPLPEKVSEEDYVRMQDQLRAILAHVGKALELKLTPEASADYNRWYEELKKKRSIHASRLSTYAMRLMLLLAANELKREIDTETVRKATLLCDHQLAVRQLHDPIDADTKIARMEESVRRKLKALGPASIRELQKAANAARYGLELFWRAVENLEKNGEIRRKGNQLVPDV